MIRIIICDDHTIVRRGLHDLLAAEHDMPSPSLMLELTESRLMKEPKRPERARAVLGDARVQPALAAAAAWGVRLEALPSGRKRRNFSRSFSLLTGLTMKSTAPA